MSHRRKPKSSYCSNQGGLKSGLLFHRLAQQAVVVGPIPYRTIIGAADSNRQTPELE